MAMELPLRMVCSDCGRSVTWSGSGESVAGAPSSCPVCGGLVSADAEEADFGLDPTHTPPSLQLTPDEFPGGNQARATDRSAPKEIGRFQVRELLGGGGFGHVYRAFDSRLERDVALKVLRDAHPPARVIERFFREARAAAQLDHPSIVGLYDAGRDSGRCWIAYQYVAGTTLIRHREARRPDHREAALIVRDLADALEHAHGRGVYHRDLKPANVLIDSSGRPKLTDFGLARRVDLEPTMTRDGAVLGTVQYMSPEQASGNSHTADGRSDLYSLGVIFHELLLGRRPQEIPSGAPSWRSSSERLPVASLRVKDRSIPLALERICLRALAPKPDERYPDARAMGDDLRRWLRTGPARPGRAAIVAAILLVAVATREGLSLVGRPWSRADPASNPAKVHPERRLLDPPPLAPSAPVVARNSSTGFVWNSSTGTIHLASCPVLGRTDKDHRVSLNSLDDTHQRKIIPCRTCGADRSQFEAEAARRAD